MLDIQCIYGQGSNGPMGDRDFAIDQDVDRTDRGGTFLLEFCSYSTLVFLAPNRPEGWKSIPKS